LRFGYAFYPAPRMAIVSRRQKQVASAPVCRSMDGAKDGAGTSGVKGPVRLCKCLTSQKERKKEKRKKDEERRK